MAVAGVFAFCVCLCSGSGKVTCDGRVESRLTPPDGTTGDRRRGACTTAGGDGGAPSSTLVSTTGSTARSAPSSLSFLRNKRPGPFGGPSSLMPRASIRERATTRWVPVPRKASPPRFAAASLAAGVRCAQLFRLFSIYGSSGNRESLIALLITVSRKAL